MRALVVCSRGIAVNTPRASVLLIASVLAWSCGGSSSNTPTAPSPAAPPSVTSIAVTGGATLTAAGQTSQMTATATFSDGSTQNVTASATWQSSNASTATVSAAGVVTAVGSGTATVTATYQGRSGSISLTLSLTTRPGNTFTATVNGQPFVGLLVTAVRSSGVPDAPAGFISLGGADGFTGPYSLFAVVAPAAVGTYTVGSFANGDILIPATGARWNSRNGGGAATVTISTLSASGASGTFSLTLTPTPGTSATGTKTVTNGVFNVAF